MQLNNPDGIHQGYIVTFKLTIISQLIYNSLRLIKNTFP